MRMQLERDDVNSKTADLGYGPNVWVRIMYGRLEHPFVDLPSRPEAIPVTYKWNLQVT